MMKTEYQFIAFRQTPSPGKTQYWSCDNRRSGTTIGFIRWYSSWRQYCYLPTEFGATVLSAGCLADIQHFLGQLAEQRKQEPTGKGR